jgi:DNA-3-methyladenine glycosylase II
VKRFGATQLLPVCEPFRLDFTVDALRRLASNVVDVVGDDGTFYRALNDRGGTEVLAIRCRGPRALEIRATGRRPDRWLPNVARMLGTAVDLEEWYVRSRRIGWLAPIAKTLRGLKPPRYPTLWEALAHAILFQQISILAAAAIMRRAVELLGEPVVVDDAVRCIAFPPAARWLEANDSALRSAGISRNKIAHLRAAAQAFLEGTIGESQLDPLPTALAAERLRAVRGIGAWSAAVTLLRGLGRLDAFPLRDSGVARALALLSGDAHVDQTELLDRLGPVRGMLYYTLLLGRLRDIVPVSRPE